MAIAKSGKMYKAAKWIQDDPTVGAPEGKSGGISTRGIVLSINNCPSCGFGQNFVKHPTCARCSKKA